MTSVPRYQGVMDDHVLCEGGGGVSGYYIMCVFGDKISKTRCNGVMSSLSNEISFTSSVKDRKYLCCK